MVTKMKRNQWIVAAVVFAVLFLLSLTLFLLCPAGTCATRTGRLLQAWELVPDEANLPAAELLCNLVFALLLSAAAGRLSAGKKLGTSIPVAAALLALYIPLFFGWGTDFVLPEGENRAMAQRPVLEETTLSAYPAEMDGYLADNVPFRKLWLRFSGLVKYGVFHSSQKTLALPGKDGWIYYGGTGISKGEDPVADYQKTNLFTEAELEGLCSSLQGFKNYLDSRGIAFRLMINLNKSHIYPEHLPDWLKEGEGMTRAEQLIDFLQAHTDIEIVYPKEALLEAKEDYLLYVPTDAHWNVVGAYVGFTELMRSLDSGFQAVPIADIDPVYYRGDSADVSNIVNAAWLTDNQWATTNYKPDIATEWTYRTPENSSTYSKNDKGNGEKILVYHDSYMNQMMPYIGKEYSAGEFIEKDFAITEADIGEKTPDVVVFEILERMLNKYTEDLSYWQKYA